MNNTRGITAIRVAVTLALICGSADAAIHVPCLYQTNTPARAFDRNAFFKCAPTAAPIPNIAANHIPDEGLSIILRPMLPSVAPAYVVLPHSRKDKELLAAFAEPTTLALVGIGLLGIFLMRWRRVPL